MKITKKIVKEETVEIEPGDIIKYTDTDGEYIFIVVISTTETAAQGITIYDNRPNLHQTNLKKHRSHLVEVCEDKKISLVAKGQTIDVRRGDNLKNLLDEPALEL